MPVGWQRDLIWSVLRKRLILFALLCEIFLHGLVGEQFSEAQQCGVKLDL